MEKNLTQEQINALSPSVPAKTVSARATARGRAWTPFTFGKASSISKQQVREVAQAHESFTYNLKSRLTGNLRVPSEVVPASVDELPYSELTQNVVKDTYLASLRVQPMHSVAILSLDLAVVLAMIDLMLGGDGKPAPVERPITEIEEEVLRIVLDMICEELQAAWRQVVEIDFSFDRSRRPQDLFRLLPSYERILILNFELRVGETSGKLTLGFPAAASSMLIRKLAKKGSQTQSQSSRTQTRLQDKLKECVFAVEVILPPTRIRGIDLLSLTAGQTLLIQHPLNQPAVVHVAGRRMFSAYPARNGRQRGAIICQKFPISSSPEKVNE